MGSTHYIDVGGYARCPSSFFVWYSAAFVVVILVSTKHTNTVWLSAELAILGEFSVLIERVVGGRHTKSGESVAQRREPNHRHR